MMLILDPNVQVAIVSVIATTITTVGVVVVAIINNRKERTIAVDEGFEAGLDERAALARIYKLMTENEALSRENRELKKRLDERTEHE